MGALPFTSSNPSAKTQSPHKTSKRQFPGEFLCRLYKTAHTCRDLSRAFRPASACPQGRKIETLIQDPIDKVTDDQIVEIVRSAISEAYTLGQTG